MLKPMTGQNNTVAYVIAQLWVWESKRARLVTSTHPFPQSLDDCLQIIRIQSCSVLLQRHAVISTFTSTVHTSESGLLVY